MRRPAVGAAAAALALAVLVAGCSAGTSGPGGSGSGGASGPSGAGGPGPTGGSASPSAAGGGLDVVAENALPGARGWQRRPTLDPAKAPAGYLDQVSVAAGEPVALRASSPSPTITVRVFRMGWYDGAGARLVATVPHIAVPRQPKPVTVGSTRTVEARWEQVAEIPTDGWPPGLYYLRLDATTGGVSYVPLIVRSPDAAGRVMISPSVLTWAAYNTWGGRDLYGDDADGGFSQRSFAVSFDRPYDAGGTGKSWQFDLPLVQFAERTGVPLGYTTGYDVATTAGVLDGAAGYVSDGHDEYWTVTERSRVQAARSAGTNLAFLGANVAYWRVRLADGWTGPDRLVVGYKDLGRDPSAGGAGATVRFRDNPDPRPEEALTGQRYECFPATGALVVSEPGFFLFEGSGATEGSQYAGLEGVEIDRPYPSKASLRPLQLPSLSRPSCRGQQTWSAIAYHALPGGAGTLSVGTMNWVRPLMGAAPRYGIDARGAAFVQHVTRALLEAMAKGPMGADHPSRDDLTGAGLPRSSTVGGP